MANQISYNLYTSHLALPPQMISLKEKNEEWKKENADRLEQICTNQVSRNLSLLENYEIIKGKFIFHHYFETGEHDDMLGQLTREFDLPKYLRHYDIISQVVNVLSGEYQKRPDNFKVKGTGEIWENEFLRTKTQLLLEHVLDQINSRIDFTLTEEGYELDKQDFESEEEAMAYQQEVAQRRQSLTPPEIEDFMTKSWNSVAEQWGQYQLKQDKQKYNLAEKEVKEFEDMLTVDMCFRHFYLKGDDYDQETWNPIYTFYHTAQEIDNAEDGDYIGRRLYLSPASIIDRYGWRMDKTQINKVRTAANSNSSKNKGNKNYIGLVDGATVPFTNFEDYKRINDALPKDGVQHFQRDGFLNNILANSNSYSFKKNGFWEVTEGYYKSQKKIGKVIYINPETGQLEKTLVDETFILPSYFKETNSSIYDSNEPNTVSWTWVNEIRDFVKINPMHTNDGDSIYLGGDPLPYQLKSDNNPYGAKLPVCGGIFNNRNGASASLVDMMKPHQIGYNVAINQLYQLMEREVGRFMIMDVNILPKVKDWGGEKGWEKFMAVARGLGFAPADTSVKNLNGAVTGGHFPSIIDLDESARMMSRINIANWFEQKALSQVGITPQRLGTTAASETATGVQQAVSQSYAQTESYFTKFSNYKKRCFRMGLDMAQYVQSQKDVVTVSYTKDDMTRAFLRINGVELSLYELGIFITDSQEDIRQLETMRQLALENNTTGATMLDLADIVTMNSPLEIRAKLEKSLNAQNQQREQEQNIQREQMQSAQEMQDKALAFEAEQNQLDRDSKEEIAYINTFRGATNTNTSDIDNNSIPDVLEYDKFNSTKDQFDRKQSLEENKLISKNQEILLKDAREREKISQKERQMMNDMKIAKQNRNKYDSKK